MNVVMLLVCPNVDKFHKEMNPVYLFYQSGNQLVMVDEPELANVRYARDLNPDHVLKVGIIPCYICKGKGILGLTHFQDVEEVILS